MFSIHHYWSWLVPKILKMIEDTCILATCSYMCQAWGDAELTGNLLCHVHNPNILEQAALVKSDGPQFSSFFTLQTVYSTVVPIGEKKTCGFFVFLGFFKIVCAITVFNVSFIFMQFLLLLWGIDQPVMFCSHRIRAPPLCTLVGRPQRTRGVGFLC